MDSTMTTREFKTDAILSVMQDKLLCDFRDVHECIEHMAGGPVWTHQLPAVADGLKPRLNDLFPDLAAYDVSGCTGETFPAWKAERAEFMGQSRHVPVIGGSPDNPFAGLPAGVDVIPVVVGE